MRRAAQDDRSLAGTRHADVGRDYRDRAGFSELLSAAGVGPDTTVVLYGGNNNWFAAYAYWLLKLRGFDDVKLLDGGRKKWELESRELVQEVPSFQPTGYSITDSEFQQHSLRLTRSLHRWKADFTIHQAQNGNLSFEFEARLDDLPDLRIPSDQRTRGTGDE